MSLDRAIAVSIAVVGLVVGALLALVGAFFIPATIGWFSWGDAAAALTIGPYVYFVGRSFRSTAAGILPALGWLVTTMYFASLRPEGDLIVTGEAHGLAFLLLGTVSAAVGLGTIRRGVERHDRRAAAAVTDEAAD
ncbi:MAG: hypothetical protein QOE45_3360 [Frankiaceae bacterium]|nr:hypothetical protein [Frankiaceae bacterium]